jgi:hypothetical protein
MSSGNRSQGRGGRGRGGRGNNSNNNKQTKKGKYFPPSGTSSSKADKSIVAALKGYHFDCDTPGLTDQAQKTLEKAIDYLGATYGTEIRLELETRTKYVFKDPPYPAGDPGMISAAEAKKKAQFQRMKVAWDAKIAEIKADTNVKDTADRKIAIAELENKIELAKEEANKLFVPKLSPEQQMSHSNECKITSQKRERESQGPRRTILYYPQVALHRQIAVLDEAGSRLGRVVACSGPTGAFGLDRKECVPDQHKSLCVCCGLQAAQGFLQFPAK